MTEEPRRFRSVPPRARKDVEPGGQVEHGHTGRHFTSSRGVQPATRARDVLTLVGGLRASMTEHAPRDLSPSERAALNELIAAIAELLGPDLFTDR